MDRLTVYPATNNSLTGNKIYISVGEAKVASGKGSARSFSSTSLIYSGDMYHAYADYNNAPDVPFVISSTVNMNGALAEVEPVSFEGDTKVYDIINAIADRLGTEQVVQSALTDNTDHVINNPYYSGTPMQMLRKVQQDANVDIYYMPPTIYVCAKGQPITTENVPVISYDTGLIGWPMMDVNGMVRVNVLYYPRFFNGMQVELKTSLPNCNGKFYITSMLISLESQTSGGQWVASMVLASFATSTPQRV
jgi:hypothetical protein